MTKPPEPFPVPDPPDAKDERIDDLGDRLRSSDAQLGALEAALRVLVAEWRGQACLDEPAYGECADDVERLLDPEKYADPDFC